MRRECRERFPRHQLQRKTQVSEPGMHHGTCVTHVPWCISGSLTCGLTWRGKCSRHSRRMRNPQFYVSVKRPMETYPLYSTFTLAVWYTISWYDVSCCNETRPYLSIQITDEQRHCKCTAYRWIWIWTKSQWTIVGYLNALTKHISLHNITEALC